MPKIQLKPKSADFATNKPEQRAKHCDMPGCTHTAEHRAPKNRGLSDYYNFCLDHVREYNKAWNFFEGMNHREVEEHMVNSLYGDRPTWRYDTDASVYERLRTAAWKTYNFTDETPPKNGHGYSGQTPEYEALGIMGLSLPVTLSDIKTRYKELAKKYHPDRNKGCKKSEELLKTINMAYTILKVAYEQYKDLPDRS